MSPAVPDHLLSRFLGILPSTPEEKILPMLIELGCELLQGFLIARPNRAVTPPAER